MFVLVLKYIVIALFLAYMSHVFSKKKAVQMDVKKHLLEKKLNIYAKLHKNLLSYTSFIAPPAYKEQFYRNILDRMPFCIGDQKMEYVSIFDSFNRLSEYYHQFQLDGLAKSSFLSDDITNCLSLINEWYGNVMSILIAFQMTEKDNFFNDTITQKKHIDLACRLTGIALQKDIEIMGNHLNKMLVDYLHVPSLSNLFKVSILNKISEKMFERYFTRLQLNRYASYLVVILLYIYVSDKYSRAEFDELPDQYSNIIMQEFCSSFLKYFPHD